jgi:hypothetical protein
MKRLMIKNAILWATVILAASFLYHDSENYEVLFGVLVVSAGLQNSLMYRYTLNRKKSH